MNEYDDLITPASDYDAQLQIEGDQAKQRLRASMFKASRENPDAYGQAKQLERTTGIPAPVAARNLPEVQQRAKVNEYDQLLGTKTGDALQNPDFASLAHDDTDNLSQVEASLKPRGKPVLRNSEFSDLVREIKRKNPVVDWDEARGLALQQASVVSEDTPIIGPSKGPKPSLGTIASGLWQSLLSNAEEVRQGSRYEFADRFGFEGMQADALKKYQRAEFEKGITKPDIKDGVGKLIYGGAESVIGNIPILAAAIITRNPALGAGLAAVQAREQAYPKYRERGGTPNEAFVGSTIEGGIEYATEKIPLSFLTEKFGKVPLWQLFVGDQAREQITEQIATHGQDLTDTLIANPNKTIAEYLKERPDAALQTAVAVLMQGVVLGGAHVAATKMAGKTEASMQAEQDQETFVKLAELAKASKVRERDPQSFAAFVDAAAADGPVQDVYIDARVLMQVAGEALPEIVQSSPALAAQMDEALKTGGDVRIPVGEYAASIAASDINTALMPHLRTSPEGMSMEESKTFMQGQADEFKKEAEKILEEKQTDAAFKESAATVERELMTQLKTANRFTDDVNGAYAKLMASFYTVQSARLGITPEEMYVKYPLNVAAAAPGGVGLDQSVPSVAKDVVRKLGGGALEQVDIAGRDQAQGQFSIRQEADGRWQIMEGERETQSPSSWFKDKAEAQKAADVRNGAEARTGTTQPGFTITDAMRQRAANGVPLFQKQQGGARGLISLNPAGLDQPSTIVLLQNADLSTFLHESGHFYLEVLTDMASQPNAPAEIVADLNKVLAWFKPGLTTPEWQAMSLDQKRGYHEQFARGFEAYLFEGKAPSQELNGLFSRFRAWLINVYRSLAALKVELSDDVRGVMDRMIATNEQILAAEQARSYAPLFKTAEDAGMTADEWQSYQELGQQATQDGVDMLQRRSLRDMQWLTNARSRTLKRLQKAAESKRKGVEAEVTAEVRQEPVYAAQRWLKTGMLPDGTQTVGAKLDLPALKEMYGEEPAAQWRYLPTGPNGMAGNDGLHPDQVAEMFGFTSGDHLVRAILAAAPEASEIEGKTDQRMLERYGDLSSPDALSKAADEAIHNDARAKFVATELRALAKATGQKNVLVKAAKEFAANIVARKKVRDVRPAQYAAAEARAAQAAEKAIIGGKLVEAATEKRNQLVNNYATRSAYDAVDAIEKGLRYLKRIGDSKTIDPEYREQIDAMLERFDLRQVTNKDLARRQSLLEWVEAQRERGFEPTIDPDLLNEARRQSYRDMTVEEFRGLVDAVKNIEHLGRLKHKLLTAKDAREFAVRVDEAATSIIDNAKKTVPVKLESNTWADKMKSGVTEFFAMHRKLASMLREMDGFKDAGALWELIGRPMNDAGTNEAVMREEATIKLVELFKPLSKLKMKEKVFIPEINASLSREGRIMVALNTGNEGNLQRLMDGDRWAPAQVRAILDTLTKPEMDFVQEIWDFVGSYRSQIGAQQKRLTGVEPEWVDATPVETKHGTYRGGYIPAKYDTNRSTRSLSDEAAAGIMDMWRAKRGFAKTRDSFTKGRADKVADRPLRKDFGVITQHVTEVTHRLAWQEFLVDASRLLRAAPIDNAIRDHYGPEALKSMRDAVEDIAAGEVGAQNAFERGINYLRTGATIAGLGWRVTTSLLQPLGLTQSMVRIGPKYVARGLAEWIGDTAKMESTAARIYEKSDFMRLRGKTMQREISEIRNQITGKSSAIEASYFYLIQKMQIVADIPTWLGQYHKAVENGGDEAGAVAQADQAVLDAQGGGQIKDLAAIQRGGPLQKLWFNFYSFFNVTYNLTSESVGRTNFKNPLSVGLLAVDMLLLYSVPAALGTLLKAALGGDLDDEDKLAKRLIADQMTYLFGTMAGLRELSSGVQAAVGLPGDYRGAAGVAFFADTIAVAKQTHQAIKDGEIDEGFLKSWNKLFGDLFHYPAGQINATADGLYSLATGKTENPGALLVGHK